jgi:tetratricopeptide (TPR) repeat protein
MFPARLAKTAESMTDNDVKTFLDAALVRHRAGRIDEACADYRQVLDRLPDNPRALRYLGMALWQKGDAAEAIGLLERAVSVAPDDADTLSDLGRVLLLRGEAAAALTLFEKAVAADPANADARHNFGVAAGESGDVPRAFEAFRTALRLDPKRVETLQALGDLLIGTNQPDDAIECWRHAAVLSPYDARIHCRIGQTLVEHARPVEALAAFEDAIAVDRSCAEAWVGVGSVQEDLGDRDAAIAAYRSALMHDAGQSIAVGRLLALLRGDADRLLVERAEWALQEGSVADEAKALVGYGIGKAREQAGDYDGAFAAWSTANIARRRIAGELDRDELVSRVDRLIAVFDERFFIERQNFGVPDERPVFVIGMPRSGTTLTERIISSHPAAGGAGELPDLARQIDEAPYYLKTGAPWPELARLLTHENVEEMAADYLTSLEGRGGKGWQRIVDKAPLNFFALGLVTLFFPNAHVVWCRRDPRDVCLSIFCENFDLSQTYATDLGDLAFYFRQYERLMTHWQAVLPVRIHEQTYEQVVADLESATKQLLGFLRLDWDPTCLRFNESSPVVQTPSRWQVRQPIYSSSVGRWRNYRSWIGPLLEVFGDESGSR